MRLILLNDCQFCDTDTCHSWMIVVHDDSEDTEEVVVLPDDADDAARVVDCQTNAGRIHDVVDDRYASAATGWPIRVKSPPHGICDSWPLRRSRW